MKIWVGQFRDSYQCVVVDGLSNLSVKVDTDGYDVSKGFPIKVYTDDKEIAISSDYFDYDDNNQIMDTSTKIGFDSKGDNGEYKGVHLMGDNGKRVGIYCHEALLKGECEGISMHKVEVHAGIHPRDNSKNQQERFGHLVVDLLDEKVLHGTMMEYDFRYNQIVVGGFNIDALNKGLSRDK